MTSASCAVVRKVRSMSRFGVMLRGLMHRARRTAPSARRDVLPCEAVCPQQDRKECIGIARWAAANAEVRESRSVLRSDIRFRTASRPLPSTDHSGMVEARVVAPRRLPALECSRLTLLKGRLFGS